VAVIIRGKAKHFETENRLKGTVQRDFFTPFFSLTAYPGLNRHGYKRFRVLSNFRGVICTFKKSIAVFDSGESKIEPYATCIFSSVKMFLVSSVLLYIVHFLLHCPSKGRGSPSKFLKITLRCQ
jgi:hypothetical protein